jgi:hypothetical protein
MEYVAPLETLVFDQDGDMYEVESQGVSLKVTLNHRMWIAPEGSSTYGLVEARNIIGKNVRYQSGGAILKDDVMTISDDELYNYAIAMIDGFDVILPVSELSARQAMRIVDTIVKKTDGSFTIMSTELADKLQIICQHAGVTSTYIGETFTITNEVYPDGGHYTRMNRLTGKVYCLRVPTEVFLVRRHGRIVWTGNSSRHG